MWFEKWFGRSAESDHGNDEPARFSAPQPPTETVSTARGAVTSTTATKAKPKNGFDPYNSGAFERKNAWERTNLR